MAAKHCLSAQCIVVDIVPLTIITKGQRSIYYITIITVTTITITIINTIIIIIIIIVNTIVITFIIITIIPNFLIIFNTLLLPLLI
jgi:hypothetical protein